MSDVAALRVYEALHGLHSVNHASHTLMLFSTLAQNAAMGIGKTNRQLALIASLGVMVLGSVALGAMQNLGEQAANASLQVYQKRLELQNLGLSALQINHADKDACALHFAHPAITTAEGFGLYKDAISVLAHEKEARRILPFLARFTLGMKAAYGRDSETMVYDTLRSAELQLGKNFSQAGLQLHLEAYMRVITATGGRVTPRDIHSFMKNSVYSRMSNTPDALAREIMLVMELGGSRAGTALNAIDRWALAHIAQNGVSREKAEVWAQYQLIENIQRDSRGRIKDFTLKNQSLYQQDRVLWIYNVLAPALQHQGIDPNDPSAIPAIAQLFSSQTGASAAITTLLQHARNKKEVEMFNKALGVNAAAMAYEKSPIGSYASLAGAWETFKATIGEQLTPTLVAVARGLTVTLQAATLWLKQNPQLIEAFNTQALSFLEGLKVLGKGFGFLFNAVTGFYHTVMGVGASVHKTLTSILAMVDNCRLTVIRLFSELPNLPYRLQAAYLHYENKPPALAMPQVPIPRARKPINRQRTIYIPELDIRDGKDIGQELRNIVSHLLSEEGNEYGITSA